MTLAASRVRVVPTAERGARWRHFRGVIVTQGAPDDGRDQLFTAADLILTAFVLCGAQ